MLKNKYQGIIFITVSAFFFALMNLFVAKAGELPTIQKAFFRNIVAAAIALVMLMRDPKQFRTAKGNWWWLIIRAAAGTLGIFLNFYAIDRMNISDASVLNKLSPFFVIVFSFIFLREKPGIVEWVAVVAAFGGALFVVRPDFSAEVVPALCGVGGGMMAGLAYTFMRKASMGGAARNLIIFFFSAFSCTVSLPFLIVQFTPMTWEQTLYLLLSGCAAAGGQIFITMAYSKAPAKEISVFDYSIVLFTAILGAIFLGQVPDLFSYIGYAIILASAFSVWLWHFCRDRRAAHGKDLLPPCETDKDSLPPCGTGGENGNASQSETSADPPPAPPEDEDRESETKD